MTLLDFFKSSYRRQKMAKHEKMRGDKKEDFDLKRRKRAEDSKRASDSIHTQTNNGSPAFDTPFSPRMSEHVVTLSGMAFQAQREEFIGRLNEVYGYRYVQRLMKSINIQAKLNVSDPNDFAEREADRVADEVGGILKSPVNRDTDDEEELLQGKADIERITPEEEELLQGKVDITCLSPEEEELLQGKMEIKSQSPEEEEIQAQRSEELSGTYAENIEKRINSSRSGGQPLSHDIKKPMERAFGADFSNVKVHTDSEADSLSKELNAKAFTTEKDIFFREGEYVPGSGAGQKLIAHELTHVVQQTGRGLAKKKEENKSGLSGEKSTTTNHQVQRVERDKNGAIVGLDMATCSLIGVAHDDVKNKSYATVSSEAFLSSPAHSVIYEIKWDAAVVPGGHHLGQVQGQASDWVVDKSRDGVPIGDRKNNKNAPYFKSDLNMDFDRKAGRYFIFQDAIEQRRLRNGSWWFRLKVVDKSGSILSQSHDVEVPWGA
jgi:hypothetical protein